MPLSDHELNLQHGYQIKPIGNRFVVFNEKGLAECSSKSQSIAVRELLARRGAWIAGYYARCAEAEATSREICKV